MLVAEKFGIRTITLDSITMKLQLRKRKRCWSKNKKSVSNKDKINLDSLTLKKKLIMKRPRSRIRNRKMPVVGVV